MVYVCVSQLTLHHNDNCSVSAIHKLYIILIHNHVANVQIFVNEDIIQFNSQRISNYKLVGMPNKNQYFKALISLYSFGFG